MRRNCGPRGDTRLADEIETITAGMRRHVERELVRARTGLRARSGPVQPVRPVVEQVVGVLRRTPQGQKLAVGDRRRGQSRASGWMPRT